MLLITCIHLFFILCGIVFTFLINKNVYCAIIILNVPFPHSFTCVHICGYYSTSVFSYNYYITSAILADSELLNFK